MKSIIFNVLLILFSVNLSAISEGGWFDKGNYLELNTNGGEVFFLKYSPDEKYFYTFSEDKVIRKWDSETGFLLKQLIIEKEDITGFDFDAELEIAAVATSRYKDSVYVYNFSTDSLLYILDPKKTFNCLSFSCDFPGTEVIINGKQSEIYTFLTVNSWFGGGSLGSGFNIRWDLKTGEFKGTDFSVGAVRGARLSGNKNNIILGAYRSYMTTQSNGGIDEKDSYIYYHDFLSNTGVILYGLVKSGSLEIIPQCFSNDTKRIASFVTYNHIRIWDLDNFATYQEIILDNTSIRSRYYSNINFDMSGRYLIMGMYDLLDGDTTRTYYSGLGFIDTETGLIADSIVFWDNDSYWITDLSKDSVTILAAGSDGFIRLFQPEILTKKFRAQFYVESRKVMQYDTVKFYNTSTGNAVNYKWDFGDGNISIEENPQHTYIETGAFPVTLIIQDSDNNPDTLIKDKYIDVSPLLITDFTSDIKSGIYPLEVAFSDLSSNNSVAWEWDFGDGAVSTEQNPVHTYKYPEYFTVKLTVSDGFFKRTIEKRRIIEVKRKPLPTHLYEVEFENWNSNFNQYGTEFFDITDNNYLFAVGNYENSLTYLDTGFFSILFHDTINDKIVENKFDSTFWLFSELIQKKDNGFAIISKNVIDDKLKILNYDKKWNKLWEKDLGLDIVNRPISSCLANDNGFVLIGVSSDKKTLISKIDSLGNKQWMIDTVFSNYLLIHPNARILETNDHNYAIFTKEHSFDFSRIVLFDPQGEIIEHFEFGNKKENRDVVVDFLQTKDDGFIFVMTRIEYGIPSRYFGVGLITKIDKNGIIEWELQTDMGYNLGTIKSINDSLFAVSCSYNDTCAYLLFDINGNTSTHIFPDRVGKFNNLKVTPNKQLLLTGYLYKSDTTTNFYYLLTKPIDTVLTGIPNSIPEFKSDAAPNPFKNSVMINYNMPEHGFVILKLYDMLGNEVAEPVNIIQEVGIHKAYIDGSSLTSGIYFYVLRAAGKVVTGKLIKIE